MATTKEIAAAVNGVTDKINEETGQNIRRAMVDTFQPCVMIAYSMVGTYIALDEKEVTGLDNVVDTKRLEYIVRTRNLDSLYGILGRIQDIIDKIEEK